MELANIRLMSSQYNKEKKKHNFYHRHGGCTGISLNECFLFLLFLCCELIAVRVVQFIQFLLNFASFHLYAYAFLSCNALSFLSLHKIGLKWNKSCCFEASNMQHSVSKCHLDGAGKTLKIENAHICNWEEKNSRDVSVLN